MMLLICSMFPRRLAYLLLFYFCTAYAIWPLPAEYTHGSEVLWLDPDFVTVCQDIPSHKRAPDTLQAVLGSQSLLEYDHSGSCRDGRLDSAIERAKRDIRSHAFVPWKFHPKGADIEPNTNEQKAVIQLVRLEYSELFFSDDEEAYELIITVDGDVSIRFNQVLGVIHAFTTFTQNFRQHSNASSYYMTNAPLRVRDSPKYSHRGLNLDICRNVVSPKDVVRTLDAMAFNKFNRLHLHASDAQSWPLEIPALSELATRGAYHPSQIWSVSNLREVQAFGFDRGIEVYVEIDMPGHTASVVESHPDLIQSFNRKPWQKYSAQPPAGQLKLENSNVTAFITALLGDLLPRVAPFSTLFHLGGDEITPAAYDMTAPEVRPHLQSFLDHAISLVYAHGLTPVFWEEHLLQYNLTLPRDSLVQTWQASALHQPSSLAQVVSRGHKALFGDSSHWYLDCGHGGWIDPDPDNPHSRVESPFLDYCGPYHNWRHIYTYDPLAGIPVRHQSLVLGGEVSMWAEQTDGANLDDRLWPRLAAAGEVLWGGNGRVSEGVTRRLAEMREWLVAKGIAAGPVQVTWCLMNPGNCVL
ncbi:MAG: hypothetical protein Q9163_002941 [Psora crenata]